MGDDGDAVWLQVVGPEMNFDFTQARSNRFRNSYLNTSIALEAIVIAVLVTSTLLTCRNASLKAIIAFIRMSTSDLPGKNDFAI